MKTYSRKRPEYQIIEGAQDLCRLCLKKAEESVPIFSNQSENMCDAKVALRIMVCVGLEMVNENCLPNNICSECHNELERYYAFRKKCEVSYQKLKSHLLAVRTKDALKSAKEDRTAREEEEKNESASGETSHITFKVNFDGSITVCNEKPSRIDEKPLVTLTRMKENMPFKLIQNNEIAVQNNSILPRKTCHNNKLSQNSLLLPILTNNVKVSNRNMVPECVGLQSSDVQNVQKSRIVNDNVENVEVEVQNEVTDADLSLFLSNILLELGVLSQQGDELALVDEDLTTIELATEDGRQLTWELVEEADVADNSEENVQQNQLNRPLSTMVVQYVPLDLEKEDQEKKQKTTPASTAATTCCSTCGRRFASRSACARHVRGVHVGARPHVCRVCGHAFSQRVVMLRHELVHQARRPHQCAQCPKSFTQRGALAAHERAHAPPHARPLALHTCSLCNKVFLYASGLTRHMSSHSGRRYQCDACNRMFKDKSSLNRHLKNTKHTVKKLKNEAIEMK